MAAKKSDAEKGPLGAWAYHTRLLLQASSVDAATAAGIKDTYLRKIEGGSQREPARRTVFDLWQFYRRLGQAQSVPVEYPPPEWRGAPTLVQIAPAGDLATAITALVAELQLWRTEDRGRIAKLEATVEVLAARALDPQGTPGRAVLDVPDPTTG